MAKPLATATDAALLVARRLVRRRIFYLGAVGPLPGVEPAAASHFAGNASRQPVVRHTIMKLKKCKVSQIGINVHYRARLIRDYFEKEQPELPVHIREEKRILGSGGGIGGFRDFLRNEDFFLVHNGDVLSGIPLERLTAVFRETRPLCAMVLHDSPGSNNVSVGDDDTIVDLRGVLEPGRRVRKLAYTGIAFMDRALLDYIPEGASDIVSVLLDIIRHGRQAVKAIVTGGHAWNDIGTPASYFNAHREILIEKRRLIDEGDIPGRHVFLGRSSTIEQGAVVRGFLSAGCNCTVAKGCRVENCVLWDNTVIGQGAVLRNAIVGNGWVVYPQVSGI